MAINLCEKYARTLANAYTVDSFLKGKTSTEYEWEGARSVKILSITTQAMHDYDRTAVSNRYGTPTELEDTVQTINITQDKSFSIVIDKGNNTQQGMLKEAGKALKAQVEEKVVPMIDQYALERFAAGAGTNITKYASLSKSNIIEVLTSIEDAMSDELVPLTDRFAFMPNSAVSMFRQSLTNCDGITDRLLLKGVVGRLGTLNIVGIPASWMPAGVGVLAWHRGAVVIPEQIHDAKVHQDPPGYSGNLLEGRYLYDAAVITAHNKGVVKVSI